MPQIILRVIQKVFGNAVMIGFFMTHLLHFRLLYFVQLGTRYTH